MTAEEQRELTAAELSVLRHLGIHCGIGGQVLLKQWQRRAAIGPWRMGLVGVWLRLTPGRGVDGSFFGLTDRGRGLAATLLTRNPPQTLKKERSNVSTR
jgi:hypothetical protein